jgi:hypothetical protein
MGIKPVNMIMRWQAKSTAASARCASGDGGSNGTGEAQRAAVSRPGPGRPKRGALRAFDDEVVQSVKQMRDAHPGWGAKTLRAELRRDQHLCGKMLPAQSSVAPWLKENGYVQHYQRHQALPDSQHQQRAAGPHQLWEVDEVDARGHEYIPAVGVIQLINLININDVCSRAKLMSYPCELSPPGSHALTRRPNQHDYQLALRLAFVEWGLPEAVSLDHDPVFIDASCKSPFPMLLHLWLIALGIHVHFIGVRRPTDHGMTERSHQTWDRQVLQGQTFADWSKLFITLNERRAFLNWHLPCATLGDLPPLQAWPQAGVPLRGYHPDHEARGLDMQRVYAYLAQGRWFRDVRGNDTLSLGGQVYLLGRAWRGHTLEIRFDPGDQHLVFRSEAADVIQPLPIQHLSAAVLLGDLHMIDSVQAVQFPLPFDPDTCRVSRINETLRVMN